MTRPNYENITKYVLTDGTYEPHVDFAGALLSGKVGNPIHDLKLNVIKIEINGREFEFKDNAESVEYLKKYIDIVL